MSNFRHGFALLCVLTLKQLVLPELNAADSIFDDCNAWQYSGSMWLLTTPDGANLPEGSVVEDFPVLVRLNGNNFDFAQAQPDGKDLRVSLIGGERLAYQIESWDAVARSANVWVRMPKIEGHARQEIKLHWGNAKAVSESSNAAVFNQSNGFRSVWHMDDVVKDEVGNLSSQDTGTTATVGMIGGARHFPGGKGVFCGDQITTFPAGAGSVHSTQAWFRPANANGRVLGWGNEKAQGKVIMQFRSPAQVQMECYFSDANVNGDISIPMPNWVHTFHTYEQGKSKVYINGVQAGTGDPRAAPLKIEVPAKMWIGGWYDNYDFVGDIDEVRISGVVRAADWIRLEYENQKPLQTFVGPLVQPGAEFSVSPKSLTVAEGQSASLTAMAGGAQKVYWMLKRAGQTSVLAVDQFSYTFDAGRVTGDKSQSVEFKAVYADGVKTIEIPVTATEQIPEPVFTLAAPARWDGRETIEVVPQVSNLTEMQAKGAANLRYRWVVSGLAVIKDVAAGKLLLHRAQNSGNVTVTAFISNGGEEISSTTTIIVEEPKKDAWVERIPANNEMPTDNQFYARDEKNEGTLHCNGTLIQPADSVFLKLYADNKLISTNSQKCDADNSYALMKKLKPGLIKYRIEFGCVASGKETVLHIADNIVCGDVYIIDGQSNALATDTGEKSPAVTNEWIRSYGKPTNDQDQRNLWCDPVWKATNGEAAELGYWGMELAKRLMKSQQVPICIFNGAAGGTRIDQHQRNHSNPTDLSTIYGRLLWRIREARLTHGVRAILWHQGENDQGADGPDGGYGWQTYQQYFVDMSAAWKQDFPNVQRYYVFQIWPNACSMGNGNGDMLREVQRSLPRLYSNMEIMSTLGIQPEGGCHYPLAGWANFASLIQPLIERDFYGRTFSESITPPNLQRAFYASETCDTMTLEFDQPVEWQDSLIGQFYLDDAKDQFATATVSGNLLTLRLKQPSMANRISYLKETSWNPEQLLRRKNGIAALTFCNVPVLSDALR